MNSFSVSTTSTEDERVYFWAPFIGSKDVSESTKVSIVVGAWLIVMVSAMVVCSELYSVSSSWFVLTLMAVCEKVVSPMLIVDAVLM